MRYLKFMGKGIGATVILFFIILSVLGIVLIPFAVGGYVETEYGTGWGVASLIFSATMLLSTAFAFAFYLEDKDKKKRKKRKR